MSRLFAFGRVLTAFFCFCGTWVHQEQEMGLFQVASGNQWIRKTCFPWKDKESTTDVFSVDKISIENSFFRRRASVCSAWCIGRCCTLCRPTLHGASDEAPSDVGIGSMQQRQIMSRIFGRRGLLSQPQNWERRPVRLRLRRQPKKGAVKSQRNT